MKTACMIVLISIASSVCVSFCYPSKPLDERSTELAWEAWLLVDQNNRQGDSGMLRRRITPKSIFILPTFTPESLPACAEGYTSDPMGRCVKMIKINDSNHFDFILQNLNSKFSNKGKRPAETSTKGPLQLNIPLLDNDEEKMFEFENETDVAIIMTPSNKSHESSSTSVKADAKRHGDKFNVENIAAMLGVNPEDVEVTTIDELTTTAFTTTVRSDDETTTFQSFTTTGGGETTTETTTTTEPGEDTTLLEGDALFFRWRN